MYVIYFIISLISSVVGGICGIGGGVIIKPVLDLTGLMSVSTISFLSGCTVLSMSIISVLKSRSSNVKIDIATSTPLAIGSVVGGILGKMLFELVKSSFQNENFLGATQAVIMLIITTGTFLYTIYDKQIKTYSITNPLICCAIGLFLGIQSSFLGIGGGPINLTVLYFFFSMDPKKAAINSLYVIMFSQIASLIMALLGGTVPDFKIINLVLMILGGIFGAIIGSHINKSITSQCVFLLFRILMFVIIVINIYNLIKFIVI